MNRQALLNQAVAGLVKQNKFSLTDSAGFNSTTNCVYRSPDGCKCAIGHIIPDGLYKPTMEGCGLTRLIFDDNKYGLIELWRIDPPYSSEPGEHYSLNSDYDEFLSLPDVTFLRDMQSKLHDDLCTCLHPVDNPYSQPEFFQALAAFCHKYNLQNPLDISVN